MGPVFNLIESRWIPVRRASGRKEWIRPADITCDPDDPIADVDVSRPELRVAIYEWLIGVFAAAYPPQSVTAWLLGWRAPPSAEALAAGLGPYSALFDLDGPGPRFLQDREDLGDELSSPDSLFLDAPGDNTVKLNKDFFVKRGRTTVLSRASAAMALHAHQSFAGSGGVGYRTSLRGGGPLTTLAVPGPRVSGGPRTLWDLIWANVPIGEPPEPADWPRIFPWLGATRTSEEGQVTTPEHAHDLQQFFAMPRRIRLVFEPNRDRRPCDLSGEIDDVVVVGFASRNYGTNYVGWRHRLTPYYRKAAAGEAFPVHAPETRIGFRHWLGCVHSRADDTRAPARAIANFVSDRADEIEPAARQEATIFAAGFALDKAKALAFAEADMPLRPMLDPDTRERIAGLAERLIEGVAQAEWLLGAGVKSALGVPESKSGTAEADVAKERLWDALEDAFYATLDRCGAGLRGPDPDHAVAEAQERWLQTVRRLALAVFDDTAPLDGFAERDPTRVVEARQSLRSALFGYGKAGEKLFAKIGLPPPEKRPKGRTKAAGPMEGRQ